MKTKSPLLSAAAAAVALLALSTPAMGAPPAAKKPLMTPELRAAQARAAQLRAEARAARKRMGPQAEPDDVTPPVLTAFKISAQVNLRKRGEQALASWTATDDLSGAYYLYVQLEGPSGQQFAALSRSIAYTDTAWSDTAPVSFSGSDYYEPGNWTATYAYLYDLHGNVAQYDAAALAALGNTVVKVANKTYDVLPPAAVSGEILTPSVTLSKTPPGLPYSQGDDFKMRVTASDSAGGAIVSGLNYLYAVYCRWEADSCSYSFGVSASAGVWGDGTGTCTLGQRLGPGPQTGTYTLYYLQLQDNAGNVKSYVDINHGGDTDFSTLFPGGTTVELLP